MFECKHCKHAVNIGVGEKFRLYFGGVFLCPECGRYYRGNYKKEVISLFGFVALMMPVIFIGYLDGGGYFFWVIFLVSFISGFYLLYRSQRLDDLIEVTASGV